MSNYKVLNIEKDSIYQLNQYVEQISKLRRMIWLDTYVNRELDITEDKIIENFRDFSEEVKKYREYIYDIKNFSSFFIVLDRNKLVGYSIVKNKYYIKSIDTLYINKNHQGNGLGSILMEKMIEKLDSKKIYVDVVSYNKKAVSFYEKYGFIYKNKHIPIVLERLNPKIYVPQIRMVRKV
ncbi:MAG: GNAT family N-acetyltransferase [Patescibacteria group bacterium]